MAKKRKSLSPDSEKRIRSGLAKLKKAGLYSPKKPIRQVKIDSKAVKLYDQFRGVVEGRQKTVKLTAKQAKLAKEDGQTVRKNRVVIANTPRSKVIKVPSDPYGYRIKHSATNGIRPVEFVGGFKRLDEYTQLADSELKKGNLVGFEVEGYKSRHLYRSADAAIADFKKYSGAEKIKSFVIYQVPFGERNQWKPKPKKAVKKSRKKTVKKSRKK